MYCDWLVLISQDEHTWVLTSTCNQPVSLWNNTMVYLCDMWLQLVPQPQSMLCSLKRSISLCNCYLAWLLCMSAIPLRT